MFLCLSKPLQNSAMNDRNIYFIMDRQVENFGIVLRIFMILCPLTLYKFYTIPTRTNEDNFKVKVRKFCEFYLDKLFTMKIEAS